MSRIPELEAVSDVSRCITRRRQEDIVGQDALASYYQS